MGNKAITAILTSSCNRNIEKSGESSEQIS